MIGFITKKNDEINEAAEKVVKIKTDIQKYFLIISFLNHFNKNNKNISYNYPIFLFFSSFNLITLFILVKKSVVAPCIVIPSFPQALAFP